MQEAQPLKGKTGKPYSVADINVVCVALFCQEEEDMKAAWAVFLRDSERADGLEKRDLRRCLALMGEDVQGADLDALFAKVDADDSGLIEYDEFALLVKGMHPSEGWDAAVAQHQEAVAAARERAAGLHREEQAARIQAGVSKIRARGRVAELLSAEEDRLRAEALASRLP